MRLPTKAFSLPTRDRVNDDGERHGRIPPSVGMYLFVIQPQASEAKLTSIYRGIIPSLVVPLIIIVMMFLFRGLALRLPKSLYG
jgi:TRAP-type C4-dicarboxylate transport system permease large subunit